MFAFYAAVNSRLLWRAKQVTLHQVIQLDGSVGLFVHVTYWKKNYQYWDFEKRWITVSTTTPTPTTTTSSSSWSSYYNKIKTIMIVKKLSWLIKKNKHQKNTFTKYKSLDDWKKHKKRCTINSTLIAITNYQQNYRRVACLLTTKWRFNRYFLRKKRWCDIEIF